MNTRVMTGGSLVASVLAFARGPFASAYEEIAVNDGAVVKGTVMFQGAVPAPKAFERCRYAMPLV